MTGTKLHLQITNLSKLSGQTHSNAAIFQDLYKMSAWIEHLKETRSTYLHHDLALVDVRQFLDVFNQNLRVLVAMLDDVCRVEFILAGHFVSIVKFETTNYHVRSRIYCGKVDCELRTSGA